MPKTPKPPKKLSTAILLALTDLRAVEKLKDVKVNMDNWHRQRLGDTLCTVCFAGAVMHQTLETPVDTAAGPECFSDGWENVFLALNGVRNYYLPSALARFGEEFSPGEYGSILKGIDDAYYGDDKTKFKRNMRTIANRLAKKGH